jgi:hypothetical protein
VLGAHSLPLPTYFLYRILLFVSIPSDILHNVQRALGTSHENFVAQDLTGISVLRPGYDWFRSTYRYIVQCIWGNAAPLDA